MTTNRLYINPNRIGPVSYYPLEKILVEVKKNLGCLNNGRFSDSLMTQTRNSNNMVNSEISFDINKIEFSAV